MTTAICLQGGASTVSNHFSEENLTSRVMEESNPTDGGLETPPCSQDASLQGHLTLLYCQSQMLSNCEEPIKEEIKEEEEELIIHTLEYSGDGDLHEEMKTESSGNPMMPQPDQDQKRSARGAGAEGTAVWGEEPWKLEEDRSSVIGTDGRYMGRFGEGPPEAASIEGKPAALQPDPPGTASSAGQGGRSVGGAYFCSECGKCFYYKSNLMTHERVHTGEKPYSCAECGKSFALVQALNKHRRVHLGVKQFACSQCGKSFYHKHSLVTHQSTHTGEKPYSCANCGKSFYQKYQLSVHEKVHTGEKPYSCSECGKHFIHKAQLLRHQQGHLGVKPFSCADCGKCFIQKTQLVAHQRVHTGLKPFPCSQCEKCFARKTQLTLHESVHTGQKPYSCSQCGKCFASKPRLLKHGRLHSGEKAD